MTDHKPKSARSSHAQEHADMLREALSRPGIREVMEVYENWQKADRAMEPYRLALKQRETIVTTDQANVG